MASSAAFRPAPTAIRRGATSSWSQPAPWRLSARSRRPGPSSTISIPRPIRWRSRSIEVNVKPIAVGQAITVKWRGKPVFIRHRTPEEIKEAEAVKLVGAARSGDRQCARHRHRQEGAAGVADRDRRLHPSRLRAARHQAGRSARRVRRLVLPLPRLAVRHVRTHPQGTRRPRTWRSRITCSRPTLSSKSADRPPGVRSNGLVSRRSAGLQQQGDRLDRSPPADLLVYREGVSHLPDAAEFQLLLEFRRDRHGDAGADDRHRHRAGDQLHAARDDGLRFGRAHHARRAVRAG